MAKNDEMIGLNLSGKPGQAYPVYSLRCPNCGVSDYREIRLPERYQGSIYSMIGVEHNTCNGCGARFNDFGDLEAPNHEIKGIGFVLGLMGGIFILVLIIAVIAKLLKMA